MSSLHLNRISAIDQLRGFVMILMALDHTRDLFHITALTDDPLNLATTSPALFFTRWITHLCAPTFVFLSGTAIYLQQKKYADKKILSRRLFIRGAWLLLLELTIIGFGIWFNIRFNILMFQVIGAIGTGFWIMALLLRTKPQFLAGTGLIILAVYAFVPIPGLTTVLALPLSPATTLLISYPPIPWIAIMLLGFGMGPVFSNPSKPAKWFALAGISALVITTLLRAFTGFGDPSSWSTQKTPVFSLLSFVNFQKYPPSLLYSLSMLGIAFILYAYLKSNRLPARVQKILEIYGSVPLFYYIVHWYLIHGGMVIIFLLQGYSWSQLNFGAFGFGRPVVQPNGFSLGPVYLVWILAVGLLYPLCVRYHAYKKNNPEAFWSRYL